MVNKALAIFQHRQDFAAAESICRDAVTIDPQCDVGVATLAQLLLQQNKVEDAVKMFEKSAEMARTEPELVNALTYENVRHLFSFLPCNGETSTDLACDHQNRPLAPNWRSSPRTPTTPQGMSPSLPSDRSPILSAHPTDILLPSSFCRLGLNRTN